MICVTLGRGRHRQMIAEMNHLAEQGAKLVELRLDFIRGPVQPKRLLAGRPCAAIATVRRSQDGGRFSGSEDARRTLLRTAIAEGVEYVDLEEDVAQHIPRYGKTKRIVSFHDFHKTPDNLPEIHARLAALDADIVKIATLANRPHDNLRMLRLVKQSRTPTIGLCMGEIGTPSRLLTGRFGSPFTYASFSKDREVAPGQLSFETMTETFHYDDIRADTEVFGVIGDPIAQSYSPLIHNAAFRHLGMNRTYLPFRIPREHLDSFLDDAPELGLQGLSVTIPHKETIAARLTELDGAVKNLRACNTVIFRDGQTLGYNTDYRAAMDSLAEALDPQGGARPDLKNKTALVLGAGGAAKAVAYGLVRRGADVAIASRTRDQADKLAASLGCRAIDWSTRHNGWVDILVNCTPVGMHPEVDETPFDKHYLKPSMLVFDTVYNPENTLLVKEARQRSAAVITGVDMFVRQAALQFKLFTGQDAPEDVMRATLKRATSAVKY